MRIRSPLNCYQTLIYIQRLKHSKITPPTRKKNCSCYNLSAKRDVERSFERHGIADYFDALVTGHDVANHKPHPEPLEKALELLGGQKKKNQRQLWLATSDKDPGAALNLA